MDTYKISQSIKADVIPAVFVVASGLQNLGAPVYGLEIVRAIQKITGELDKLDDVICVQKSQGLWRINLKTKTDRANLLLRGLTIRGHSISVLSKSPRLVNGMQTIRLNIGNVPFEIPDHEVKAALEILGLTFGSQIQYEFYKDEEDEPTNVKTGRRYVSIATPSQPLPEWVKVADKYRAYLQYNRKKVHGTDKKDSDPKANHLGSDINDSESDDLRWPPTPSGWWKEPRGYHRSQNTPPNNGEEDISNLPSVAPYEWIPGPRQGFPPMPLTRVNQPVSEARLGMQASLKTLLGSNNADNLQTGDDLQQTMNTLSGGFWSAEPQRVIQEEIASPIQDSMVIDNNQLSNLNSDKSMSEEEYNFLSQTSLKTLCEDIGIIHVPIDDDEVGRTPSQNPLAGNDELISTVSVGIDLDTVPVNGNMLSSHSICSESGVFSDAKVSNTNGSDVPLPSSPNTSQDWWYDTAHAPTVKLNNFSDITLMNDDTLHHALDAEIGAITANEHVPVKLSSTEGNTDEDKRENPTLRDHPIVESVTQSSGSETHSISMETHQQDICLGGQLTIDNFTLKKSSRSRSLTKEEILENRKRSSSKRRLGSPKETSLGKRSAKNKSSPKSKKKKSKGNKRDKVTKDASSGVRDTAAAVQSNEYFDNLLNKQASTTPT